MELNGHFDPWLVGLSYLIATAAAYISLRLAPHTPDADKSAAKIRGVLPAAFALGLGIWSMHFTGMAAFHIHAVAIGYRWDVTFLSLVVAVVFTSIGFATLTLLRNPREGPLVAGIPMGAGILSMHFLGMLAMTGEMTIHFQSELVIAAGGIAVIASVVALFLSRIRHRLLSRLAASMVMGLAICGMHYTGMKAAVFTSTVPSQPAEGTSPSAY